MLPHILQKVNRVSFGLMTQNECMTALEKDPRTPTSKGRLNLAIPFVGKDAPLAASEFAHPDVTIGLTILAYKYSGLRIDDFKDIVRSLQSSLVQELGPRDLRKSAVQFNSWINTAQPLYSTNSDRDDVQISHENQIRLCDLRVSHVDNAFTNAFRLLKGQSEVINFYLSTFIFPRYMLHQIEKLGASTQEFGSDMLSRRRVGFSGTPSSLIPVDLGKCQYEPGSESRILQTLSSNDICTVKSLKDDKWTPESVLDFVLSEGQYNALIDTGALVTGLSNLEVVLYLLFANGEGGLHKKGFEGVVYLDENDRKMVLCSDFKSLHIYYTKMFP
jgi:hypothetical protein